MPPSPVALLCIVPMMVDPSSAENCEATFARDHARLFIPRAQRATDRIDHATLYFVNGFFRKVFGAKRTGVIGKLVSE